MSQRYKIDLLKVAALTELERAYIAGFFDGEGCISVSWREASNNVLVHIAASQNRPGVPVWLHTMFGGTLFVEQPRNASGSPHTKWAIRGHEECRIFLQLLRPYLRIKAQEADEALAILANRHTMTGEQMEVHKTNIRRFRTVEAS